MYRVQRAEEVEMSKQKSQGTERTERAGEEQEGLRKMIRSWAWEEPDQLRPPPPPPLPESRPQGI